MGYFSNPSPETILYGIVSTEHSSSISHPNNTQQIVIDLIYILNCLPASGATDLRVCRDPIDSCLVAFSV